MYQELDIFWLIVTVVVTFAIRGAYRRMRYHQIIKRRRRNIDIDPEVLYDRPVQILRNIQLKGRV